MAVNTTVEVTMPQMGDSVSEGTILEWHKKEGDKVAEDELLVEISTDKVDAEVPSPAAGTVVKIHAAEGDTVSVGAVLAEISQNGAAPAAGPADAEAARAEDARRRDRSTIVMPAMGESVTEGTILEWAKQPGEPVAEDETIVEISTDKVDAEVPAPAPARSTRSSPQAGDTVHVGQVLARMTAGNGAAPAQGARAHRRAAARTAAPRRRRSPTASRSPRSPPAWPPRTASTSRRCTAPGPAGRISKADVLAAETTAPRARRPAEATLIKGAQRDARALHGRVALGADRDLVPHAHGHDAGRAAASSSRRPASASPSPT